VCGLVGGLVGGGVFFDAYFFLDASDLDLVGALVGGSNSVGLCGLCGSCGTW